MRIVVAGLPSRKTHRALITTQEAVAISAPDIPVEWVDHIHGMRLMGVSCTPTVIVNGRVRVEGRIPSLHEVQSWIREGLARKEVPTFSKDE